MTLNLFNQFEAPTIIGIPLTIAAILFPSLLFFTPCNRLLTNRTLTIQSWLIKKYAKEIFLPLNNFGCKWTTILTSLMAMLLGMNLLGLLPYTFTPTTHLSLSLGLSFPLWLATVLIGARKQFSTSTSHLLPQGSPTSLIPILIIIETISLLIRPLALGVRLTANLTAGHLLIQLISATATIIEPFIISTPILIVLVLLTTLEIAVAIIQAYVFTLLLSLYLQENT